MVCVEDKNSSISCGRAPRAYSHALTFTVLAIFFVFLVAAMGGCGKKSKEKAESAGVVETEPKTLTIKGSDTMLPMIAALADAYTKLHPDTQISVTGGGSTVGINALLDGTVDLCMSSRALTAEESTRAEYLKIAPQEVVVALDGVTVIVHPKNPVNELALGQLRQIFSGKIKSWREVGGPDQAVQVISRNSDSGTSTFFAERVLQKENYKAGIQLAATNAAVVRSVGQELWSIGYVGFAFSQRAGVKVVGIKKNSASPAILPLLVTLRNGSYPIERPLRMYSSGKVNSLAVSFLEFVLSSEGRRIVEEKGYVP